MRTEIYISNVTGDRAILNPLNAELNPICHLLALLGAHHILHVSRIRVKRGRRGKPTCTPRIVTVYDTR